MQLDNLAKPKPAPGASASPTIQLETPVTTQIYSWAVLLIPCLGTILAGVIAIWNGVTWIDLSLLISLYTLTSIGINVGYHRHFSHCAFQANPPVRVALAILGAMAAQGPPIFWAATHRRHHQYTDIAGDPHSPHLHDSSLVGFFHSHLGWMLKAELTNTVLYAKDLLRDPLIARVNRLYHSWLLLGLVIPAVVGGSLTQTWMGALTGLLWGGLVRIFLVQQVTYCINSVCHLWGSRPFDTRDQSTNNAYLAIPTVGDGWHNNHHAFPNSAIIGLEWWQLDLGGWLIRVWEKLGWVWDVKAPTAAMIAAKRSKQPVQVSQP